MTSKTKLWTVLGALAAAVLLTIVVLDRASDARRNATSAGSAPSSIPCHWKPCCVRSDGGDSAASEMRMSRIAARSAGAISQARW